MPFDNAYHALTEEHSEGDTSRWAFGTGFSDPLAGVSTELPSGVDANDLAAYCMLLGDDALVFSQQLSAWVTHAPELEDEVALANIALDLLGQARLLLARAGLAEGRGRDEDALAYFRRADEFANVRLVEHPNADFAVMIVRLLVFATWRLAALTRLAHSREPILAAVAANGVRELTYHRDYAARWAVRLGAGTTYSHERMTPAVAQVWPWVAELYAGTELEHRMVAVGVGVDPCALAPECERVFADVLAAATLTIPTSAATGSRTHSEASHDSKRGQHTDHFAALLMQLQGLARAHPEATW